MNIPGITTAALNAIQDENTRIVLTELVSGWQIRNAGQGTGADAFVTRDQLTGVLESDQAQGSKAIWPPLSGFSAKVSSVQADVASSQAFIDLSTTVATISNAVVLEQQNRVAAVQAVADDLAQDVQAVADDLAQEVQDRIGLGTTIGSAITGLQEVNTSQASSITSMGTRIDAAESSISTLNTTTGTQATSLTALTTRLGTAESSISTLSTTSGTQATTLASLTTRVDTAESGITTLNTTTGAQATALTSLTTRVGTAESNITNLSTTSGTQAQTLTSLTTRVDTAESNISTLNTTTGNQATTLTTLTATVGQKARTFFQASAPGTPITGDLWFDSDDGNKAYRWSGATWDSIGPVISLDGVTAAITAEETARINADNAITTSLTTQFSGVNGSIALLQGSQTTTANDVSALSTSLTTLQGTVGTAQTAISTETTARVNADGEILAKYSVKIDTNGYVSGYGLLSEANNSTPLSSFIVRADKFAIGSPSGPGITPAIPFTVLTTTDAAGNAPGVYMDDVFIKKASITTAKIGDLQVGTLQIQDNAVTVPDMVYSMTLNGYSDYDNPPWTATPFTDHQTLYELYKWDDTLTPLTNGELLTAYGKATNPWPTSYLTYEIGFVLATSPVRDYSLQKVVLLIDASVTIATPGSMPPYKFRVYRFPSGLTGNVEYTSTRSRLAPRGGGAAAYADDLTVSANAPYLCIVDTYINPVFTSSGGNTKIATPGLCVLYDTPPAGSWTYSIVLGDVGDTTLTTQQVYNSTSRMFVLGAKK